MKVLLVTFGSRGDVHPMLGLGRALQARGHQAMLLSNPVFREEAVRAGLAFVPVGTEEEYRKMLAHPKLWHPIDGLGVMWRYLLRPALRPTYAVLHGLCQPSSGAASGKKGPLVVASPLAMGARVAQEKLGIQLVTAYTSATLLRTVQDPLTIAKWHVPPVVPLWVRQGVWKLLDKAKLDPLVKPALESLRRELALPPMGPAAGAVFDRWMHSPLGGLTLFPKWFAPTPPDWPAQVMRGTFPIYDDIVEGAAGALNGPTALDAGLKRFLDTGPAPVVFMPGSAQQAGEGFFRSAIEACQRLGVRGVLLGHLGALAAKKLPDYVWAAPYHPFGSLLPRARAIVHHGGVGTCAQALRAGLAQLVWPQAYDQFDNAMRLEQLGVGLSLKADPVTSHELAAGIDRLLSSAAVQQACLQWAGRLTPAPGLDEVCQWLEQLA
ncbi:glycosyltransferase [Polaromonas sp. JS666]|uniref:glycosyltransferase n=1 Tax=Polaromonas sp. (strain JS666 / ATCC BAA-500) TaxID=296591 RepID=UPI0000464377|nr:nucleotide disphospho-sugar-binding domain-containing protein [Polaromonas sp. JS666]ABE46796.1 glycosyl transferase, family 28 [Polaromonas sp. JS666]